jgi:MinD superfamily P-loop ATPase
LGNNDVYDYLKKENIPLLMKIPFDKTIASIYSKGALLCKDQPAWQYSFKQLFNKIEDLYGNSRN